MIEVDGKQPSAQPTTLEAIYELLEPYHRRTVRLRTTVKRYDSKWGGYITTTARSLGKLVGLSVVAPRIDGRRMRSADDSLIFTLEGQQSQRFQFGEFAVDVFQEDTHEWITLYDPKLSKETDR